MKKKAPSPPSNLSIIKVKGHEIIDIHTSGTFTLCTASLTTIGASSCTLELNGAALCYLNSSMPCVTFPNLRLEGLGTITLAVSSGEVHVVGTHTINESMVERESQDSTNSNSPSTQASTSSQFPFSQIAAPAPAQSPPPPPTASTKKERKKEAKRKQQELMDTIAESRPEPTASKKMKSEEEIVRRPSEQ